MDERSLRARLDDLVGVLDACADLLAAAPFVEPEPHWCSTRAPLADALLTLSDAEVDALERDPAALVRFVARHEAALVRGDALVDVPPLPADPTVLALPEARAPGVPGRKWTQVRAFTAALPDDAGPWLDWCAGKGHLGRLVADLRGGALRCVERDAALCAAGRALAGTTTDVRFETADVLDARIVPRADEHVLALHACGALHEVLVDRFAAGAGRALALAPCCYHRTDSPWRARSRGGPPGALARPLARLAVTETVTAGATVRRRHRRERRWRLAFAALLVAHGEAPGPQSSLPARVFAGAGDEGFVDFCTALADRRGLTLPRSFDPEPWLAEGREREARVRRLELARASLRRVLELRMVLDRALVLAEAGRRVRVGIFCARATTPRNLMLLAD